MKAFRLWLWCSTVIKKEASKKPEVELNSDVLPVNWSLFYHTAYDIKQITWMHNIDVTLQQVSAQKDANNASEHIQLRAHARKRESLPWRAFNSVLQGKQIEFTIDHIL